MTFGWKRPFTALFGVFSLILIVTAAMPAAEALAAGADNFEAAVSHWQKDEDQEAVDAATKALASGELDDGQTVTALYIRGYCNFNLENYQDAIDDLTAAIDTKNLNHNFEGDAYTMRGSSFWILDQNDKVLPDFDKAIEIMDDPGFPLYKRSYFYLSQDNKEAAMADFTRLGNEFPDTFNSVKMDYIWRVVRWAKKKGKKDDLFNLLMAVKSSGYTGPEAQYTTEGLMQELANLQLERGNVNKALVLIYGIEDPGIIMETMIDNRYRPLWGKYVYSKHADLKTLLEKQIETYRGKMEQSPKNPRFVEWYADALRQAGRNKEAIKVLEDALADKDRFDTPDGDEILWLQNDLAYAYLSERKDDKAFETFDEVMKVSLEDNTAAISQYINYASSLLNAGRFDEALEILDKTDMDYASDFGDMFILMGKACVYYETGKKKEARELGKQIYQRWQDNPSAAQMAMLCLEDYDRAKDLVMKRVAGDDTRTDLLAAIQNYTPPTDNLKFQKKLFKRYRKVLKDPKVRAEIYKYGRILDIPLSQTYWGDF